MVLQVLNITCTVYCEGIDHSVKVQNAGKNTKQCVDEAVDLRNQNVTYYTRKNKKQEKLHKMCIMDVERMSRMRQT